MKAILRIVTGIALVLIGIAGLLLPVMPGFVFLIPGLLILSDYFPPLKRLTEYAKKRWREVSAGEPPADRETPGAGTP
jgi:uncharacterized membrane protein YbaN (DUF454 family)